MLTKTNIIGRVLDIFVEDYPTWVKDLTDGQIKALLVALAVLFVGLGTPMLDLFMFGWGDDALQLVLTAMAGPLLAELNTRRKERLEIEDEEQASAAPQDLDIIDAEIVGDDDNA